METKHTLGFKGGYLIPSRCRVYTTKGHKQILLSWIQRRCEKCQRFLSKQEKKYCARCGDQRVLALRWENENYHNNLSFRELRQLKSKVRYNPERFNVGDLV